MIKLSKRLQTIADMTTGGERIVDVGTDHAYIPIYMVQNKKYKSAIAADVNKGPIAIANEHISELGLSDSIGTCLSDGLHKVDVQSADTVTIAGMGGLLIKKILEQDLDKAKLAKELILQPQSEYKEVRLFLQNEGFVIQDEESVIDDGKFYFVIKCVQGKTEKQFSEAELEFGPMLLNKKHPVLLEYINKQIGILEKVKLELNKQPKSEAILKRIKDIDNELCLLKNALGDYYEM